MKIIIEIPNDATSVTVGTIKNGEIDIQRYNAIYIKEHKVEEKE